MNDPILYAAAIIGLTVLIISLEWGKVKKVNLKAAIVVLIALFFLGSALIPLFT